MGGETATHHAAAREIDLAYVREVCSRYQHISPEEALMPVFQELQEHFGYVNETVCYEVAHQLHLSPAQIYASLTFYWIYKWRKPAQHRVFLCEGSGCYTTGTTKLRRAVQERLGIGAGEATFDGKITFQPISTCMGACEWSPLVEVDGEFFGFVDEAKMHQIIDDLERAVYASDHLLADGNADGSGDVAKVEPTPNSGDADTSGAEHSSPNNVGEAGR